MKRCMKMCNTSIILKHPLLFTSVFLQVHQAGFSQAHQLVVPCSLTPGVHIYIVCKHLKKIILLFMCKVASGSPAITQLMSSQPKKSHNAKNKSRMGYWELYRITQKVKSSAQKGAIIIRLCLHSQVNLSPLSLYL